MTGSYTINILLCYGDWKGTRRYISYFGKIPGGTFPIYREVCYGGWKVIISTGKWLSYFVKVPGGTEGNFSILVPIGTFFEVPLCLKAIPIRFNYCKISLFCYGSKFGTD